MSSCESCWRLSGGNPDEYHRLVGERRCTPEEQAGDGFACPSCRRLTIHQYTEECMNPECGTEEEIEAQHE